jgi:hypothetical protein
MTTATAEPPATATELFHEHFRRVVFNTHVFTGRRQLKAIESTLKGQKINAQRLSKPRVSLLPHELDQLAQRARAGVYSVLTAYTFPCDSAGTRIVALRSADEFITALTTAIVAVTQTGTYLAERHDEIAAYNRDFWLPLFDNDEEAYNRNVGRHVPSADQLTQAFSVDYRLESAVGFGARFETDVVREFFETAQANAVKFDQDSIVQLATGPLDNYVAALVSFQAQLAEGERVTPQSLTKSLDTGKLCLTMSAIIAPDVRGAIEALDTELTNVHAAAEAEIEARRSGTAYIRSRREQLDVLIERTVDACVNRAAQAAMLEQFGVHSRGLSFTVPVDDE